MTDLDVVRGRLREGTARLLRVVDDLDAVALAAPSALPGWSRAHVVGHLARNAEALGRLTVWAATGVETPMYSGPEQRAADIETSSTLAPAVLRVQLKDTADDLEKAFDGLGEAWQATVRSALGRVIPATQIPWMRVREVWLHAVDLDAGVRFESFPADLVDALLADVAAVVGAKPDCPPVEVRLTDRDAVLRLGSADAADQIVEVSAADALGWISGRSKSEFPALPAWI